MKAFVLALGLGALFALSAPAHAALVVDTVQVTVGGEVWCQVGGGCAHPIWNLGTGVSLNPGETLVLTQTSGFNFDTSDACPISVGCSTPTVRVNTSNFSDTPGVLNAQGLDPVNAAFNEARSWTLLGAGSGFALSLGYADNIHSDPCLDAGGTCFPGTPWQGTATVFLGAPAPFPADLSGLGLRPCGEGCFDAGALLITARAVPNPATLLLMGVGLLVASLPMIRRRP